MKTNDEILQLFKEEDYTGLGDELKEFWSVNQSVLFDSLLDEFMNQPNNFSLVLFKQRLRVLIGQCLENRKNPAIKIAGNDFYEALCELDFKTQTDNFEGIYINKKIAPFLLHRLGDGQESDLKWLYNQILYKSDLLYEKPVIIDCSSNSINSFEGMLGEFIKKFDLDTSDQDVAPMAVLRTEIERRLNTGHFVCIIKNAGAVLWNEPELSKLFNEFLVFLNSQVVRLKHKNSFILLFIDPEVSELKPGFEKFIYWYDQALPNKYLIDAVMSKDVKIFDLSPVQKIQEADISNWIAWSTKNKLFFEKTKCLNGEEKKLLEDGCNPYQVIESICFHLNIKMEEKWIS